MTHPIHQEHDPIKAQSCWRCDFASGYRGMDRCHVCDGTGSTLQCDGKIYPNTRAGYEEAEAAYLGARR